MEAMTEKTLDKTALRDFAVNARKKLKERIELQANLMGFYEDNRQVNYEFEDDKFFKINGETFSKKQTQKLREQITKKSFATVIDEVAYTWFNRFIALYYMEVNGYSENNCNIISNLSNISQYAVSIASLLSDEEKQSIIENINNCKEEPIFKTLIIHQCNVMNKKLPFLFEEIEDYTELLFPSGLLNNDSAIREMLAIDKSNWQVVEIIGWLYQYYIAEAKEQLDYELKNKKGRKVEEKDMPIKTQIFTPKWIVKYMVENSVGKMWLEAHPNPELQSKFKYYLESAEQDEEVKQKLNEIINKNISPEDIKVLDPACGSGHILITAFEVLYEIYKSAGYMEDDIAQLILTKNLYGLDICDRAAQLAQLAVIIKAREYDKNISNKVTELNITSIQESNWMSDSRVKECLMNGVENQLLAQSQIELLQTTFKDAKEYGSLLEMKDFDFEFWNERLTAIQSLNMGLLYQDIIEELNINLPSLIKQAKIMQQKYECVIANPPYLGSKYFDQKLGEFISKNYPNSKSDSCVALIEKVLKMTAKNCFCSLVTMQSWMFLSSFEEFRTNLLNNATITTMTHMGNGVMRIAFGTCATVWKKILLPKYKATYSWIENDNITDKDEPYTFPIKDNGRYNIVAQNGFHSIPGSPIAYWASDSIRALFKNSKPLSNFSASKQGLITGNNDLFLKLWYEVNIANVGFNIQSAKDAIDKKMKWFPYNKGGTYRKWYGNNEYIVNWYNSGFDIINYKDDKGKQLSRPQNIQYYFKEGITWSSLSSGNISFRNFSKGYIFDAKGQATFPFQANNKMYIISLLNTKLINMLMSFISPTMDYNCGIVALLPVIYVEDGYILGRINILAQENIEISKDDWDSFETSWDFQVHPLLRFKENGKVSDSFNKWKEYKQEQFNKLKSNEEELNKLFIEIYGLQDDMTPEVDDKDITIALADETRDIKSLMSYAVGCMLGRYSLDEKGLAFAGGEFDLSKSKTLEVDEDGILPILSDTWFEDDIVEEFKRFLKKAFGELYFNENMQYIADVLGRKGSESAEDRIRTYYLKDFYKDHLQTYKKRPIYWMFTSGKEKAFNCLMYLHRYDKTTLSRIRKDYLHEYQAKLDRAKAQAEDEGNVKLNSLYSKYQSEILEYDRNLQVLADSQIELDLDDGVKVNYAKFKGLLEAEKDVVGRVK